MQASIFPAVVSGRSPPWCWAVHHINGSMSLAFLAGRKMESINGTPVARKPRSGNLKPVALIAYPIMNSSLTNCIVLDPFGGSGSTLIACEQTGRICHTIELDEKYADVIVKRYIEQVGASDGVSVIRDGLTYQYDEVAISEESLQA